MSDPIALDLIAAIGRVRRAMPRNADVMLICDAAEASCQKHHSASVTPADVGGSKSLNKQKAGLSDASAAVGSSGFDRKAYQRDYMRKQRAKRKKA